ncbi:hypothetical protein EVB55_110 [Rhizobium phage RHph_Y68]|uniref:Uncharacterized protein n=1 Tax=Rhizobium phage RHph_Y68 TaxID=2509787 RepID=A0A7S5QY98_9CAUD|nr:hypothetical protein PP934_gp110 [Rhizobium phage RHph_Y68]QIG68045.1 hypothetical protein EVB55_110 [Rhizobium phage RHph_Y68]
MNEYFTAMNENGYFLRERTTLTVESGRPKFQASGSIVKFSSLFEAVAFFDEGRFDTSKVTFLKNQTTVVDSWSFEAATGLRKHLTAA